MTDTFGNRGTGRTTAIVQAAKDAVERGVRVLIVGHNYEQARRIAEQVGPRTECVGMDLVGERMRGSDFVPFVDHNAVEMFAHATSNLRADIAQTKRCLAEAVVSRDNAWAQAEAMRSANVGLIQQRDELAVANEELRIELGKCRSALEVETERADDYTGRNPFPMPEYEE